MERLPQRTCMGCRSKKDKIDLIRIVKNKNGEIKIDPNYKLEGRGAYICKNEECLKKSIKNKKSSIVINDSMYEKIKEYINGGEVI